MRHIQINKRPPPKRNVINDDKDNEDNNIGNYDDRTMIIHQDLLPNEHSQ